MYFRKENLIMGELPKHFISCCEAEFVSKLCPLALWQRWSRDRNGIRSVKNLRFCPVKCTHCAYTQNLVEFVESFLTPTCPKLTRPGCDKLPGCPMAALSSTLTTRHAVIDENNCTSSSPHTHLYSFISTRSTLWRKAELHKLCTVQ